MTEHLWLAIFITIVASTACSIGKALQKEATRHLPKLSLDSKILQQYIQSKVWITGVAADLGGGIIQIAAFALAPVSVVQPISSVGLVGLALYSHFVLRERLSQFEWTAVVVAGIGTLGLGASSANDDQNRSNPSTITTTATGAIDADNAAAAVVAPITVHEAGPLRMLFILLLTCGAVASLTAVRSKQRQRHKRPGADKSTAALYGLQAGGCFGLSAASCRIGFLMAARMHMHFWALLGLVGSICLSSSGFILQTCGLKEGSAVVVVTCVVVSSMGAGVLVGVLGLAEPFPTTAGALAVHTLSILAILVGVMALALGQQGSGELIAMAIGYVPQSVWAKMPVMVAVKIKSWAAVKDLPQHHLHTEGTSN